MSDKASGSEDQSKTDSNANSPTVLENGAGDTAAVGSFDVDGGPAAVGASPADSSVDIEPGRHDVFLGSDQYHDDHPGNSSYIDMIQTYSPQYKDLESAKERKAVVRKVVKRVNKRGRFLCRKPDSLGWIKASEDYIVSEIERELHQAIEVYRDFSDISDADISSDGSGNKEPLLSNKEILAAIGYHLDEVTNEITPIVPDSAHNSSESGESLDDVAAAAAT
jgi:hypothetical protein